MFVNASQTIVKHPKLWVVYTTHLWIDETWGWFTIPLLSVSKLKLRTIWNPYVGWRVGLENELKSGGPNQTALQVFCLLLSRLQFCGASFMALFGKWQDLRNFGGIDDIRQHFNVADNVWAAFTGVVGDFKQRLKDPGGGPQGLAFSGVAASQPF